MIKKEREGHYYEGKTVQVIPHVTDEIKQAIHDLASDDIDVVITEIGGTVGDIEGLPFLEAIRQFALDVGRENCLYIHLTFVIYLKAAAELKTKPTQHSVGDLRQIGIQPDILICRTEHPISSEEKDKIALFCNVERKAVIEERDKQFSIYEVPLSLVNHGLDEILVKRLRLKTSPLEAGRVARHGRADQEPQARGPDRRRRQVHEASRRLQVGSMRPSITRGSPTGRASWSSASRPRRSRAVAPRPP